MLERIHERKDEMELIKQKQVNEKYLNIKTYFKKYLQSYLNWIYRQNDSFATFITTEELTDYFICELQHPLWFQLYLKVNPFRAFVETHNYIEKYKKNAEKMAIELEIIPKKNIIGLTETNPSEKLLEGDKRTIDVCNQYILDYSLNPLSNLTKADALLLQKIVKAIQSHER